MSVMHGLELDDLRLVRVVATVGSYTTAAATLHYSQSGVSRRVAQLERTVGGPIFTRLPRGVRPTALGEVLLAHADELLRRVDALTEDLETARAGTGGRLRVGSFPTANSSLTPAALERFRAEHPEVAITIEEGLSSALVHQVTDGVLDVAVVSDYPLGTLDPGSAKLVHLLDDELLVALPPTHPRARARSLRLTDLADATWISASPENVDTVLIAAASQAGFEPHVDIHLASWTAKLSYVAAGFGITIVPGLLAAAVPPTVVVKSLGGDLPVRRIFAAVSVHPPAAADLFLDELQAVARSF